uniref:Toll-like receptor 21 n=1 Tax=Boleophthalmus pectinirostris TaxID=150288 RepID=A0A482ID58_BOLPE|nr:toll-like receptor 21 [Boleophthalmus pectinirostris]
MTSHTCQLLVVTAVLHAVQLVTSYSFNNCINKDYGKTFTCWRRTAENISAIVGDLPLSTINLTISFNPIRHIPDKSFVHLPNLIQLSLERNKLSTLGEHAFQSLHQLQVLNLSTNNISHLEPFLFKDLKNLNFLALTLNKLKVLPNQIFLTVLKLQILHLEENNLNNFSQIASAVSHLQNLRTLNVSFNSLTSLCHSNASLPPSLSNLYIQGNNLSSLGCRRSFFSKLKYLDLSFNPWISTEAFEGVDLAHLNHLRLQATNVSIIHFLNNSNVRPNSVDFSNTSLTNDSLVELCKVLGRRAKNITHLNLNLNLIQQLSSTSLQYCPQHIEQVSLSRNKLKDTNCLLFLNHTKDIKVFKAEHNHLGELVSCKGKIIFENLIDISYRYNWILSVSNNAFYNTPNLVSLTLNMNSIAKLSRKAFEGLRNLENLRLDNNLMRDLYSELFQDQVNLKTLNLNSNRISVIFSRVFSSLGKLKILDLGGNTITRIEKQGFHGLTSLSKLILDDNNLKEIDSSQYYAFSDKLKVLSLKSNKISFFTQTTSSPFMNLSQLSKLSLDSQRPYGLILLPQYFFRGLHSLKELYLTNNHISHLAPDAFDDLTELQYLNLDYCCVGAVQLQPGMFKNLRNLTRLIVENMGLQNFSKEVFGNLTKLRSLQLNRNVMHSIDVDTLESLPNLEYIDIRNVPLSCTCENSQLQNWTVNNANVQVVFLHDHPCQESTKHKFYSFDTKVCYADLGQYLCFITAAFLFLFTSFPIIYVKLYWTFKYSYFVFRAWFSEQWRRLRDEEENCVYDAFISYNSSDEQWVMEQLVPNLEGNGSSFKLCLHHRDFEVGRNIVDNIVSAVYSSRKTICVVSRNFLRSEWCSLEIQLASYRLFDEHRDVLLPVFLETISEQQISSYHRMRKVMLKKTYLQWPGSDCTHPEQAQKLFWTQLRRAMKENSQYENDLCKSTQSECEISGDIHYLQP